VRRLDLRIVKAMIVLALLLLVAWFLAVVAFKVTVAAVHLVLVLAVVLFAIGFVRSRAGGHESSSV
jgi:hypothetical protein